MNQLVAFILLLGLLASPVRCAMGETDDSEQLWQHFCQPPAAARPWVVWYWMNANVSEAGITADLEAMQRAGIGGAYLMPVEGPNDPPDFDPPTVQLTPRFWKLVRHAARQAHRLGLQLGMHACDGWSVAGGPWVTPELSMQKLVWSRMDVEAGADQPIRLTQPQANEGYYQEVAVLAFPSLPGASESTATMVPAVTTSNQEPAAERLANPSNEQRYRNAQPCWIEYAFDQPFTCRSITIAPDGNNYQCQRLKVFAEDTAGEMRLVRALEAPRHGWQDEATPVTHTVTETTSHRFRFTWDPAGSEPGAEDLDFAKWSPVLKVKSIVLHGEPALPHWRGKSGALWRRSPQATEAQLPSDACVSSAKVRNLSSLLAADGTLDWTPPAGRWTVMRFGHTSTGRRNVMGGGAEGLECDKLNPAAVQLQWDRWFGEARRQMIDEIGLQATEQTLTTLHLDSWECGSQNWTPGFEKIFAQVNGYPLRPFLPCLAGVPIDTAAESESVLQDVRRTINQRLQTAFFDTLSAKAQQAGVRFTAESTAPTMVADGLAHYAKVDAPLGEFWLNTPTHDKPNDLLDAISGGHVYGKQVIGAEAFTQLRIGWDETPAMLKPLGDRNLALGVNRLIMHVWVHNPWLDRKPGQLLGGVGSYFQRDQPWMTGARGWMDYLSRTQAVLQQGRPVADIAVWTGDDLPSRAVLPESLTKELPGLLGPNRVQAEAVRRANDGLPMREQPLGVRAAANTAGPDLWAGVLGGYRYDSINSDALLRLARAEQGRLKLATGASYGLLVLPGGHPSRPNAGRIHAETAERLAEFVEQGVTVLCGAKLTAREGDRKRVSAALARMRALPDRFLQQSWGERDLRSLGISPDVTVATTSGELSPRVVWNHRAGKHWDAYFFSNQTGEDQDLVVTLRKPDVRVQLWNPVTGQRVAAEGERQVAGRTVFAMRMHAGESLIAVAAEHASAIVGRSMPQHKIEVSEPWEVGFEPSLGERPAGLRLLELVNLAEGTDPALQRFAGWVTYRVKQNLTAEQASRLQWLVVDQVDPLAEVTINGQDCGVLWSHPLRVPVADALCEGINDIQLRVACTWKNRLLYEERLPESDRQVWLSAPLILQDPRPTPLGVQGKVWLE